MLLGLYSRAIGSPEIIKLILNVSCFEHSESQANDLNCFPEDLNMIPLDEVIYVTWQNHGFTVLGSNLSKWESVENAVGENNHE